MWTLAFVNDAALIVTNVEIDGEQPIELRSEAAFPGDPPSTVSSSCRAGRSIATLSFQPADFQEPIDECTAVISVLTVQSDAGMLNARDKSCTLCEVDPNIPPPHESNFARYLCDPRGERVGVPGFTTWYVVNKAGSEQVGDCLNVPACDCLSHGESRFHHACVVVHMPARG